MKVKKKRKPPTRPTVPLVTINNNLRDDVMATNLPPSSSVAPLSSVTEARTVTKNFSKQKPLNAKKKVGTGDGGRIQPLIDPNAHSASLKLQQHASSQELQSTYFSGPENSMNYDLPLPTSIDPNIIMSRGSI